MITKRLFLLLFLLFMAFIANAQDFKVIKDTTDYVLKEVDSGYFYTYGIKEKYVFDEDYEGINFENGILKLSIENGKFVEIINKDSINKNRKPYPYNKSNIYVVKSKRLKKYWVTDFYQTFKGHYLINMENGTIDTLDDAPTYSPSFLYYGYCYYQYSDPNYRYVLFKNVNTGVVNKIYWKEEDEEPFRFRWLDDKSFMFDSNFSNLPKHNFIRHKYYLVEIKH